MQRTFFLVVLAYFTVALCACAGDTGHNSSLNVAVTSAPASNPELAHLIAGPLLGDIGKDTVTIKAESDIPAAAIVEYAPAEGQMSKVVVAAATSHTITLTGLQPGTTYHYQLGLHTDSGTTWSTDGQWTTDGGSAQSFRFAVWGDSRPSTGSDQPVVFAQLLAILQQHGPLALAVSVGDNVQLSRGSTDEQTIRDRYLGFIAALMPMASQVPFYSAIGNHEEPDCQACLAAFRGYLPLPNQNDQTYYSFDYGPAHLTVLNSRQDHGAAIQILGDAQWKWLQADLAASKQRIKFVFLHDSIYHEAKEEDPSFTTDEQDRLHQLLLKSGVTAVFAGHSHYYDYYARDGIAYVITGGAGSPLYEQYVNPSWEKNEMMIVDVTPTQVTLQALLPDGTPLDQHTLTIQ